MKAKLYLPLQAVGKKTAWTIFFTFLIYGNFLFGQCWKNVSAGYDHALALKDDGTLWAWGGNCNGQLGNGTTANNPVAMPVGYFSNWAFAVAGGSVSFAIRTDGTLWAWGRNSAGQLGIGNTTSQSSPVQVGVDNHWASVAAAAPNLGISSFAIGLKTDGTLWSWGNNGNGQLGIGTTTSQTVPVQVGTDADWVTMAAGSNYVMAIKTNGTLWAWGSNGNAQQGTGLGSANQLSPVQVGTDNNWTSVSTAINSTYALKSDGTLWAWGANSSGQLGIGNTTGQVTPVQVGVATDWASVKGGKASFVSALKTDGTGWIWGLNVNGQLCDGTTNSQSVPEQIGAGASWTAVAGGGSFTLALRADNTIWAGGGNSSGQLGTGNTTNQTTLVSAGVNSYPALTPALGGSSGALQVSCTADVNGYYGFINPPMLTRKLFAIHPEGNTGTFTVVYDSSRNTNSTPLVQSDVNGATSLMGRLVTVSYSGALSTGVRVRFYYSPTDSTNTSNALNTWISANPGATAQWQWVKFEGDAAAMAGNQTAGGFTGTYTKLTPDSSGVETGISFVEFRNITSFSTFGAVAFANTTNSPLPITLHAFTATLQDQCAAVKLDWSTDLEQNSKDFTIQRSTDGNSWNDIGIVPAAGNSSVRKNYSYTDNAIGSQATYFYRLRLNDLDGTSKYSQVVSVKPYCNNSYSYLVYPNPVKDHITVQAPPTGGRKIVAVYNNIGQCLVQFTLDPGSVRTIRVAGWSKGLYPVIIKENGRVVRTEKIMKQ